MNKFLCLFVAGCSVLLAAGEPEPFRSLPAGEFRYGPALFRTGEPFVLTGTQRGGGEPIRTLTLPPGTSGDALYLLHALEDRSFGELGTLEVRFADGSRQLIPVSAGKDCGDWREAAPRGNAAVALRDPIRPRGGWYATGFRLNRNDPRTVTFSVTAKKARWLVAAVAAGGGFAPLPPEPRCVIHADDRHLPIVYRWGTLAGSALDFSALNDAPAGKYGFVRATPEGHFTFENAPEKRIRFFGTNIVYHANFPDRETAVRIADELARNGCNLARFHLNDDLMLKKDAANSLDIDPAQLDKLEFLAARLKERGIYFTIDLYGCRRFRKGDGPELFGEPAPMAMKYVSLLVPAALENLKEFSRRWLTHVNPYTGTAWKDEPAIAFINLLNEDDAESVWQRSEPFRQRFLEAFRRETGRKELEIAPGDPPREFIAYLNRVQSGVLDELTGFVRNELGMKTLITSLNSAHRPAVVPLRAKFDLVDNHQYHDHPRYSPNYRLPWHFRQVSAISTVLPDPWRVTPTRIYGKPFVMTEYNFCHPNVFRSEGGPLTAAYASLQDWDGLVHYRWASDEGEREIMGDFRLGAFSGNTDPLNLCVNRIIAFVFRRGLVKPASERCAAAVPDGIDAAAEMSYTLPQRYFWLFAQIGSERKSQSTLPDPERAADPRLAALQRRFRETGVAESATGEIRLDSRADTFTLAAPEVLAAVLPEGDLKAGSMKISGADGFQSVTLIALDGLPVERSRRMLLFHLTDVTNSGIAFADGSRTEVVEKGTLPLLLRRGSCRVTLAGAPPCRVAALGLDGAELGAVAGTAAGEGFSFPLDNSIYGGCFAYLLERKEK